MLNLWICYRVSSVVHGGWSAWGNWGTCAGTCTVEGQLPPQQQRERTCTNPPPSVAPRGNDCSGPSTDSQHCTGLPFCAGDTNIRRISDISTVDLFLQKRNNSTLVNKGIMSPQWMETGGLGRQPLNVLLHVEWDNRHRIVNVTILHPNMEVKAV